MNQITLLTKVSKGSVSNLLQKAAQLAIDGKEIQELPNEEFINLFYPEDKNPSPEEGMPDFEALRNELAKPAVKAQLLWEEYSEQNPDGMKRSTFYTHLKNAGPPDEPKPSMHQVAKGGERLLIDYSGLKISYIDESTGAEIETEIFVANWMASSFLYVEASASQTNGDWIASNVRALQFFGCVPTYFVPDNLKSGIIKANYYDPTVNRLYGAMAEHYGAVVLPARSRRPKDKASVESNVRFIQTHILGRLRNRRFTSLRELNEAIWELLEQVNARPMQRFHRSRKERFEELDRPYASSLPDQDYHVQEIKDGVKVGDDHHVNFRGHYYSVPWRCTGCRVNIWLIGSELQVYSDGERIAIHPLSAELGAYTTNDLHRPPNHLFVRNLKPLWVLSRSESIGPRTHDVIRNMIAADPRHCEVAIRKGLGIVELTRDYPKERVESAVAWALDHAMLRLEDIRRVLEQELDLCNSNAVQNRSKAAPCIHDNIRGSGHYKNFNQIQ